MFPFAPQPAPTPVLAASPADSIELRSRKSTADGLFQAICGAIGGLAAHSARSAPQYFPLLVVGCIVGGLLLAFAPLRDKDFLGLHRSGALILIIGALLPFWDLLIGIPPQILIAVVIVVVVLAIALIAVLGRN